MWSNLFINSLVCFYYSIVASVNLNVKLFLKCVVNKVIILAKELQIKLNEFSRLWGKYNFLLSKAKFIKWLWFWEILLEIEIYILFENVLHLRGKVQKHFKTKICQ